MTEQEAEGITGVRTVPIPELLALIAAGEITDNESLGALLLALVRLGRVHSSRAAPRLTARRRRAVAVLAFSRSSRCWSSPARSAFWCSAT